jgi:Mrp family chromosome partitioning ATPase
VVPQPAELIANGRLKGLLQRLAPALDWIAIDSLPATSVSDACLLAELCDVTPMVVQAGSTAFDPAKKVCEESRTRRLLGVVLDRAAPTAHCGSYYRYCDKSGEKKKLKR